MNLASRQVRELFKRTGVKVSVNECDAKTPEANLATDNWWTMITSVSALSGTMIALHAFGKS